jgi:hypothetical protein
MKKNYALLFIGLFNLTLYAQNPDNLNTMTREGTSGTEEYAVNNSIPNRNDRNAGASVIQEQAKIFSVQPAEFAERTTLYLEPSLRGAKVFVFNRNGERIMQIPVKGATVTLDFRNFLADTYFVCVKSQDRVQTKKIIKQE